MGAATPPVTRRKRRCPPCLRSRRGRPRIQASTRPSIPVRKLRPATPARISARTNGSSMSCTSATWPIPRRWPWSGGTSSLTTSLPRGARHSRPSSRHRLPCLHLHLRRRGLRRCGCRRCRCRRCRGGPGGLPRGGHRLCRAPRGRPVVSEEVPPLHGHRRGVGQVALVHLIDEPFVRPEIRAGVAGLRFRTGMLGRVLAWIRGRPRRLRRHGGHRPLPTCDWWCCRPHQGVS